MSPALMHLVGCAKLPLPGRVPDVEAIEADGIEFRIERDVEFDRNALRGASSRGDDAKRREIQKCVTSRPMKRGQS